LAAVLLEREGGLSEIFENLADESGLIRLDRRDRSLSQGREPITEARANLNDFID